MRLILASGSPRRAELLRAAGYVFEIAAAGIDERPRAGEAPETYVRRLAEEKAAAADLGADGGRTVPGAAAGTIVLGADTEVIVDGAILGKPADAADADRMLRLLSGRDHRVLTGVSLRGGGRAVSRVITTIVRLRLLSDAERAWYIESGEWRGKAGGYAIQGLASRFIPHIDGSYTNVVGLPIAAVEEMLQQLRS